MAGPVAQPGEMDQLVSLLKPSTHKDRFGQHTIYNLIAQVAARVTPLRGREFLSAGAMQSPASVEVAIWYRGDIDGTWRLDWMGRHLELISEPIDVDAKHVALELMCRGIAK